MKRSGFRLGFVLALSQVLPLFSFAAKAEEKPKAKVPIILDTDIGGDIDDALALGVVLTSPELDLRGVTTVDGDAHTRALIVCRLLDVLERGKIPVAAGGPPRKVADFSGQMQYGLRPAHKRPIKESAVDFLAAQLKAAPGELTIACIGPLTNIAALLDKHPETAKQIKRLVIMGGSIRVGYNGRPPAEPEWNIKSDVKAAQRVFASGVPIALVPLDATATLSLDEPTRKKLFAAGTVLGRHLHALYQLWDKQTPILFDPAAVAMCVDDSLLRSENVRIEVDDRGFTRAVPGQPNLHALTTKDPEKLIRFCVERLRRPALWSAQDELVVEVTKDNQTFVRGNPMTAAELERWLRDSLAHEEKKKDLVIRGDRAALARTVVEVMTACQNAGATIRVSVADGIRALLPHGKLAHRDSFPHRVHVAETYETDIERRWWLSGKLETKNVPAGSTRACRAVLTNDFDDLQGDKYAIYKAVIFNPVPGPPMGSRTRLAFRYHLTGTDSLRLQIYTLTKGYHRQLTVKGLEQGRWAEATIDMTQARRPDGSGGPLSEDERIDDIQFYADPAAELLIDEIVLYEAADEGPDERGTDDAKAAKDKRPFPKQIVFTGWFDTGRQGAEWPGDFEIVPHKLPLKWKAAKAAAPDGKSRWIRVDLRGARPLPAEVRLRFRYFVRGAKSIGIELGVAGVDRRGTATLAEAKEDAWTEADIDLRAGVRSALGGQDDGGKTVAHDIVFRAASGAELLVDDVLLYEPRNDERIGAKRGGR